MRLGKDIEGKPIISITDGRILGRSKDLYVDAELQAMAGLYVGSEGVIRRKTLVIPREDITLFGIDVILVKDAEVITNEKDLPEAKAWIRLKDVEGRQVRTPGGTKLGVVGDVVLDEAGSIVGFSLSRVFVEGPLAEQGAVPREAVVDVALEDGAIGVDLAKLEGLVSTTLEKTPAEEAPEPLGDKEQAEETSAQETPAVAEDDGFTLDVEEIEDSEQTAEAGADNEVQEDPPVAEQDSNKEDKGALDNE